MSIPKIDLEDPRIAAGVKLYSRQALKAYELVKCFDDAVRPVYAFDEGRKSVTHVGTGVLFTAGGELFLLSASHVFDAVGTYQLLIGATDVLRPFKGDRFSSARGASGTHRDDPIDASVFHIIDPVPEDIRASALQLSDLDLIGAARAPEFYVAAGFRVSQSKSTSIGHTTILDRYPTMELDEAHYRHFKLDRERHLALAFEGQNLVNGRWQKSPSLRGFSGGAMFRIAGLSALLPSKEEADRKVKLSAILIEQKKAVRNKFESGVIGTRLGVHFHLIDTYLPELGFQQMLHEAYEKQFPSENKPLDSAR